MAGGAVKRVEAPEGVFFVPAAMLRLTGGRKSGWFFFPGAVAKWPKAKVCKTFIRGFDSHPHLHFLSLDEPDICWRKGPKFGSLRDSRF